MVSTRNWAAPAAIALLSLAVGALALLEMTSPARVLLTLGFLLVCPGLAYVRLLELNNLPVELVLALAASLSINAAVAMALLYTGSWSADLGMSIVVSLTLIGVAIQVGVNGVKSRGAI